MIIPFYLACLVLVVYCIFIAWNTYHIRTDFPKNEKASLKISIIIPCRNEESNIAACLRSIMHQTLPAAQYEIIVVDDFSEDHTVKIATEFTNRMPVKILHSTIAGKKNAITMGIAFAVNDIIITTDADCTMSPEWLGNLLHAFNAGQLNMLCGPINFNDSSSPFQQLQQAESAAIVGISSVMLGRQKPATCNGANLMFRKSVFNKLGGYGSHSQLATGDDDLLMHAFYAYDKGKVAYILNQHAMVHTKASISFGQFLQQRGRWLSKRKFYIYKWNNYLQMLVFFHLITFFFVLTYGIATHSLIALGLLLNKFLFDLMFGIKLRKVFNFKYWLILLMPFFELYIIVLLVYAQFSVKKWKGRSL